VRAPGEMGLATLALVLAACGRLWGTPSTAQPPVHLVITAGQDTNHGGPLYVVVRKVDRAGFLAEDYDAIADHMFSEPRDPAIVRTAIVRPGDVIGVDAERELGKGEVLGVYCMFSSPGAAWRIAVIDPKVQHVTIRLGASGIVTAEQR
jgi:hypothetical protein